VEESADRVIFEMRRDPIEWKPDDLLLLSSKEDAT
jgi:hypothetical protein